MDNILNIQDIHITFDKGGINENHVLKGISFKANPGDFITVIGGNGAGKSTLLNSISGSLIVDEGTVEIGKNNVTNQSDFKRAKHVGRVFQDPKMGSAARMSIEENMAIAFKRGKTRSLNIGLNKTQRKFFKEQVATLDLGLENRMRQDIGLLSGGQRQALTLLMATMIKPQILLLDEHTAALDPKTAKQVLELTNKIVTKQNITTFMVTHNMNDALNYGNRLIMLHQGQIVVDIDAKQKANLTTNDLIELFKNKTATNLDNDALLLG